ncbi:MAG: nitroreductase family protein [Solobacterium sp.]|nr:nitroreductase family protein [Solobacterium sp.]
MEAMEAILTRRSTRRMKPEVPERELLEKVIAAGRHAPSGSNAQKTHLIVVTDRRILDDLAGIVANAFAEMEVKEDMYISLKRSVQAARKGGYRYDYNAPVLVIVCHQKDYGNAMADSACVIENMLIGANALDLGACYINQLHWLSDHPALRAYLEGIGMKEEETVTGSVILGYGENGPIRQEKPLPGNPVTWLP